MSEEDYGHEVAGNDSKNRSACEGRASLHKLGSPNPGSNGWDMSVGCQTTDTKEDLLSELRRGKHPARKPFQRWKDKVLKNFGVDPKSWWNDSGADHRASWRKRMFKGAKNMQEAQITRKISKGKKEKKKRRRLFKSCEGKDGHPCDRCPRVFPKLSELRRHQTGLHTKPAEKLDLVCHSCQRHFTTRSARSGHKCEKHRGKEKRIDLSYPTCPRIFTNRSSRTRHMKFCG